MHQVKFIIANHSFILNRGLSGILKEFRNVEVSEIIENLASLELAIATHKPSYLIISSDLLSGVDALMMNKLYQLSPRTEIIHLITSSASIQTGNIPYSININFNRKEISDFFTHLLEKQISENEEVGSEISEREKVILGHVAMGKTNKDIADELNISIHTVITHRKNITAKLGIKSISGLTVYAIFNGIISMEDVE